MKDEKNSIEPILKSFLFFSASFIFGYCLTVFFHEFGHALFNRIFGCTNFTLFLHPFGKSAVESHDTYSILPIYQQALIFIMGPMFDILCSTLIAFPMWRTYKQKYLPFMMWNGLSFLGQGIGIMMDVIDRDSPWGMQTDGGRILNLTGISPTLLFSLGTISLIIGCILLSLILPLVGISKKDSLIKISLIFIPGMVSYFTLTTIYASFFDESRLGERKGQLISASLLTIVLTLLYKPLHSLYHKIYPADTQLVQKRNLVLALSLMTGVMLVMWAISASSYLFILSILVGVIALAIIVLWKFGMEQDFLVK